MKKVLSFIFLMFIFLINTKAQDQIVNARNINVQVTNPQGQGGGAGAVPWNSINVAYVLAPLGPDYGFCMSVVNNNPTNAHTFTVTAFQTGDNGVSDYSHNTGRYAALTIVGTPSPVAASSTQTFFVRSNGAAKIAFVFSGAGTLAGNPDTVDIYAVQTTSPGCGTVNPQTGQQYTLATPNTGTSSAPPIMAVSDGLGTGFLASMSATNPTAAENLFTIYGSATKNIYLDKIVISTSAAANINISTVNTAGTGCPVYNSQLNLKVGSAVASTVSSFNALTCTTNPTSSGTITTAFQLGAGQTITIDMKGLFIPAGSTTLGIETFMNGALTGTITQITFWYEK